VDLGGLLSFSRTPCLERGWRFVADRASAQARFNCEQEGGFVHIAMLAHNTGQAMTTSGQRTIKKTRMGTLAE